MEVAGETLGEIAAYMAALALGVWLGGLRVRGWRMTRGLAFMVSAAMALGGCAAILLASVAVHRLG